MPRSAVTSQGRKHGSTRRRSAGFTLIEILISLTILGFMLGILMLGSQGNGHREISLVARNLQNVLLFTRDEAELQGMQLGVQVIGQQLLFVYLDEEKNEWKAYRAREFEEVELPQTVTLSVHSDDAELLASSAKAALHEGLPDLLFLSSGEMNNYEIQLVSEETPGRYTIISDGLNLRVARTEDGRGV